jgi:outer membrane protein OmpA-like peptidoglycan-associated protein
MTKIAKVSNKMQRQPVLHSSFLFAFLIFNFSLFICYAQSTGEEIETLLSTNAVTYASAARFLLEASDTMVTSDPDEAFRYAAERNWLPKKASANDAARMDGVSLLLMRSFGIKGGILYSLFKSPHYAFRELTYKNVIQGGIDPAMNVSGERLLFITSRALSLQEEEAAVVTEREQRRLRAEDLATRIKAILQRRNIADVTAEATDEGVMIRLSDIQFLPDSAELAESEKVKLQEIADILKSIPEIKIQVAGHTALAGSPEGRLEVSRERAQAVASYLVSLGVLKDSDITVVAYGSDVPIADNATAGGMAANRRVEIIIQEK